MSNDSGQSDPLHAGVWRRRDSDDCLWVDCGNTSVVYHRPSGRTHILNPAGRALLDMLLDNPMTTVEIVDCLWQDEGEPAQHDSLTQMESMLRRLEHLGFVERI